MTLLKSWVKSTSWSHASATRLSFSDLVAQAGDEGSFNPL